MSVQILSAKQRAGLGTLGSIPSSSHCLPKLGGSRIWTLQVPFALGVLDLNWDLRPPKEVGWVSWRWEMTLKDSLLSRLGGGEGKSRKTT